MAMFGTESSSTGGSSSTSTGDSPHSWSPGTNVQPGAGVGLNSIFFASSGDGPARLGVAPFESGQYVRLLNRGRGGYLFADESGVRVRTDHRRGLINTVWCVQILGGDSPHILLRGAYGRYVAGTPLGAGEGHIGILITQRLLETMDTNVMWRTIPGPRGGGVVLINASSFNGASIANAGTPIYDSTRFSLQCIDRFNARFSSMMEWEVQVIPTRVQRPPFQVGGAAWLCGLQRRGSGEIQVGVRVADDDGNFNIPGPQNLSVPGRSLIELGSVLEDRLGSNFRFRNMSIFIRAGSLGQPFPLLTDLPSELDYFEVVVFMVGTPGFGLCNTAIRPRGELSKL
uniref:DUF569 domain-containing protein n=1 Tax=Oryza meridionalis TaxID=40149 RepID=A0A0E0D5U6_9ORYZ